MKYIISVIGTVFFMIVLIPLVIVLFFSGTEDQGKLVIEPQDAGFQIKLVNVWMEDLNQVKEVELEEYIKSVIASEMPASFEIEALKAQAVAARTYAVARVLNFEQKEGATGHEMAPLCNTIHCQVYRGQDEIRALKSDEWMNQYWEKLSQAVEETSGQILFYDGSLAGQALFHSSSGGKTENSEDVFVSAVPYLRSVESPYEEEATHRGDVTEITVDSFANTINQKVSGANVTKEEVKEMKITARSSGDRVAALSIGETTVTGREIREFFSLPSAQFQFTIENDNVVIVSTGYGHGVGMSQYGANGMAKKDETYDKILIHYYTGVEIRKMY